jgi:hypothetical protein
MREQPVEGSFDMQKLDVNGIGAYLEVCGLCLARAHTRTGDSAWISGYLGSEKEKQKCQLN